MQLIPWGFLYASQLPDCLLEKLVTWKHHWVQTKKGPTKADFLQPKEHERDSLVRQEILENNYSTAAKQHRKKKNKTVFSPPPESAKAKQGLLLSPDFNKAPNTPCQEWCQKRQSRREFRFSSSLVSNDRLHASSPPRRVVLEETQRRVGTFTFAH